ncbi:isochorismatase family cysteine hydrolase [Lysinibacillus irui]|uniref:Cysteine hydrolase n=1 Tax=Lysinibacillus irui TaxID=2998077 RepID=A0AAJ5RNA9_9BACI|nr:isochorismatase family cysteine hydrolase [Lysinibacillus irui]MEA0556334.1 isochorismatase family cysteine hydrolase [Lysinibacillus irui]MEA0566130.1 isochorismatase family cysteine hydrolase [Lysinibacillus irui]MEA0977407.1 isochorismatase family cysteine hydrolase [Lysinibacillus irui]MEA1043561.1 isochorismatase family cysteine hydrolase [Lysinibacillus irui]WDV07109.1 cysteine hydrolase [Lysinibacillus irui]
MMKKRALINIDYTVDFVATDGALTCGEPGQLLEHTNVELTKEFIKNGDFTVFAIDVHEQGDVYHPETKLFPPHNIRNTEGRNLYGALKQLYEANKEQDCVYYMDKTRYSAFAGTDLELKLRERGITELHLIGVCTDICVLHTAVDAYNKGFDIVIHKDAVASFNQAGHEWALGHFEHTLGATII